MYRASVIAGLIDANVNEDELTVIDEWPESRPPCNDPELDLQRFRVKVVSDHRPWGG